MPTLTEQLLSWFDQNPTSEQLLEYLDKLDEQQREQLNEQLYILLKDMQEEKNERLQAKISEFQQWQFLQTQPDDWSQRFVKRFTYITSLLSGTEYQLDLVYVGSLLKILTNDEQLDTLLEELKAIYLRDGQLFEQGATLSQADREHDLAVFHQLTFLTDETVNDLVSPKGAADRYALLNRLIAILTYLQPIGIEQSRTNPSEWQAYLWECLRTSARQQILEDWESDRLQSSAELNGIRGFLESLEKAWDLERIRKGETEKVMLGYINKLNAEQRQEFARRLTIFLQGSFHLHVIFDPVSLTYLVTRLSNMHSWAEADSFTQEVAQQLPREEMQKLAKAAIRVIFVCFYYLHQNAPATTPTATPNPTPNV